jgi:hypothetical protein
MATIRCRPGEGAPGFVQRVAAGLDAPQGAAADGCMRVPSPYTRAVADKPAGGISLGGQAWSPRHD